MPRIPKTTRLRGENELTDRESKREREKEREREIEREER
jgi:hypothetical protein